MDNQLTLFKTSQLGFPKYSLFLAIFPDQRTAQQITGLGNTFRQKHGLLGKMRPIGHLHVSLLSIGHATDVPETVIETVSHMCKAVAAITSPFEIKFGRVLSFRGKPGNYPLVLTDDNHGNDGIRKLHGLLWSRFSRLFPASVSSPKFMPHLTLLYDKKQLVPELIEPVCWRVKEIALVRSEVGATKYCWLGRWTLGE